MQIHKLLKKRGLSGREKNLLMLLSLMLIALGILVVVNGYNKPSILTEALPGDTLNPEITGKTLPRSRPTRLIIPKLNVDTHFVDLGLNSKGEIEVPKGYEEVGWYKYGPTPGELGPAVVLGHVDSYMGPAVFFYLGQLDPGDIVEIDREDGTTAKFRVDKLERYKQEDFPTSLVYGDLSYSGLRLITCSGTYNRESRRYDSNLIVYASLVD
jgi:sortase (surface protein transpeptidase)